MKHRQSTRMLIGLTLTLIIPVMAYAASTSQTLTAKTPLSAQELKKYYQDLDQDNVPDPLDECPNTPPGVAVNALGCELDSDLDGVADSTDICMQTTAKKVNFLGCNPDTDRDGVKDFIDQCPDTPLGSKVNMFGCIKRDHIELRLTFATGLYQLTPQAEAKIREALTHLKKLNKDEVILVEGHTDAVGCQEDNLKLFWNRAESVRKYLTQVLGLPEDKIYIVVYGERRPVASNQTAEGRARNRRTDLKVVSKQALPQNATTLIPDEMKGYVRRPGRCPLPDAK